MDYLKYVKKELLILIPVLYFLGIGLKKSKIKDNFIPLILGAFSVVLSLIWVLATTDISSFKDFLNAFFTAVTQGILTAGTGVYANQLVVQSKKTK